MRKIPLILKRGANRYGQKLIILGLILIVALTTGCTGPNVKNQNTSITPSPQVSYHNVTRVEVVFIHPVPGCSSCDAVGIYANETVNTYFLKENTAGRLSFVDVNLNLPENRNIVERYGVYSESLWFGIYDDDGFHKVEDLNVWYKIYNKDDFMSYLKGELEQILYGNSPGYGSPPAP